MYLSFYKLKKKPFQISTDPEFLWFGEKHKEAFATLKYGILDNKGFLLLTGDIGTGKTTLINALVESLGDDVIVARVPDPGMETMDLMNFISYSFEMGKEFVRKDLFLVHFSHFLNSAYARGKKVLLIIDEAQRMTQELLEEVRQLSNIERQETKLLNIFLIGQNEFNEMLKREQNRALLHRITMNYNLERLNLFETAELIRYRLKVAGAKREIFTEDALLQIFTFTDGTPRKINILCDHCLISAFVAGKNKIDDEIVRASAQDLALPVISAPVGKGGHLPDKNYLDKDTKSAVEKVSVKVGQKSEDSNKLPAGSADNRWSSGWGPKIISVGACCVLLIGCIYFFRESADPANTIKKLSSQTSSAVVARTTERRDDNNEKSPSVHDAGSIQRPVETSSTEKKPLSLLIQQAVSTPPQHLDTPENSSVEQEAAIQSVTDNEETPDISEAETRQKEIVKTDSESDTGEDISSPVHAITVAPAQQAGDAAIMTKSVAVDSESVQMSDSLIPEEEKASSQENDRSKSSVLEEPTEERTTLEVVDTPVLPGEDKEQPPVASTLEKETQPVEQQVEIKFPTQPRDWLSDTKSKAAPTAASTSESEPAYSASGTGTTLQKEQGIPGNDQPDEIVTSTQEQQEQEEEDILSEQPAENSDNAEQETDITLDFGAPAAGPIDSGKVIDWLLNKRKK